MSIKLKDLYLSLEESMKSLNEVDEFEDIDLNEGGSDSIASLEELFNELQELDEDGDSFIDDVCDLEEDIKSNENPSVEEMKSFSNRLNEIGARVGMQSTKISTEHYNDPIAFQTIALEALSGFWARYVQVLTLDIKSLFDGFHRIFRGRLRNAMHYKERLLKAQNNWNNKKDKIRTVKQLTSYAGQDLYIAFIHDNKLDEKPLRALSTDVKYAEEVIINFTKRLLKYSKELGNIIRSGDYRDSEAFTKTVITKVGKMGNPSNLFDKKLLSSRPILLTNKAWELKDPTIPKKLDNSPEMQEFINTITQKAPTRRFKILQTIMSSLAVFHDIILDNQDVDKIITTLLEYSEQIIWYGTELDDIVKVYDDLAKNVSVALRSNKVSLDKKNVKVMKEIISFVKFLARTQYRVCFWEMERTLFVLSRGSIWILRVVNHAD